MKAQRTLLALAITALPCACVIDGVPLPDERGDDVVAQQNDNPADIQQGIYATVASGVTVVFGVPGIVQANATAVALSGSVQSQSPTTDDGSFNIALIGAIADTIDVRILAGGKIVDHATITVPPDIQLAPDGATQTVTSNPPVVKPATTSVRVNATMAHLDFPAGSFPDDASVAIADLDRGTTQTASARPDGSLNADVTAAPGDTLYVVTITATTATAPYVITAPQ